jgi:hypothetical protein
MIARVNLFGSKEVELGRHNMVARISNNCNQMSKAK